MASVEVLAGPERRRPVEWRAGAGDCSGGIRTRGGGSRRGTSGRCDAEFDLPLESGSASRGEWLRSGAGGTGWQWCRRRRCRRAAHRNRLKRQHYNWAMGTPLSRRSHPSVSEKSKPAQGQDRGFATGQLGAKETFRDRRSKVAFGSSREDRRRNSSAGPHSTAETLLTPTPPEVPRAATRITPSERLNRTQRPTEEYIRCELRQFALGIEGSLRPRGQGARPCRHN